MTNKKTKDLKPVKKPFLTGGITDETTPRSALLFLGSLILVAFMTFLVSASTAGGAGWLRILVNVSIILLVLFIFFTNGANKGTEAVSRGEILWQRQEKGQPFSDSEKKMCYHGLKGFTVGLLGTIPLFLIALLLAFQTRLLTTDSGTLPSWLQSYLNREEVGGALMHYTQPEGLSFVDYLRMIVRVCLMPFVNLVGGTNRMGILWIERLSPLLVLLPAAAYGFGYRTGRMNRSKVHTAISEANRLRIRREKKAQKARRGGNSHRREPEQLN